MNFSKISLSLGTKYKKNEQIKWQKSSQCNEWGRILNTKIFVCVERGGGGSTINWPPRSPDFTQLDLCLRGLMKSEVYRKNVDTRDELLVNILDVIACIKGTSRRTQTNNTPCLHTSCKVHWCWRWNFSNIYYKLYKLCHLNNKYRY